MTLTPIVTRFAPSPTGLLHLGHVLAAKTVFQFSGRRAGTCLLRIEDIDHTRCKPEYSRAIYEDMAWLGFEWPKPVRVQSAHMTDYAAALEGLKSRGLVYPCFKSRKAISDYKLKTGEPYRRTTAPAITEIDAPAVVGKAPAWRLSLTAVFAALGDTLADLSYREDSIATALDLTGCDDPILARKDIGTSYLMACTYDDAVQGITHIVRGQDLKAETDIQVLLQAVMGLPIPDYYHHPLMMKSEDKKLSKRDGDISVRALRESGLTARQVLDMATPGIYR